MALGWALAAGGATSAGAATADVAATKPAAAATPPARAPVARLLFLGDVTFGRDVGRTVRRHGADAPFEAVRAGLRAPDLTVANLEGPLVPGEGRRPPAVGTRPIDLTGPAAAAGALARAGIDAVSLANNHSLDAGEAGLRQTRAALAAAGVAALGVRDGGGDGPSLPADAQGARAAPVVRTVAGLRVALLAYTTVVGPGIDPARAAAAVAVVDAGGAEAAVADVAAARAAAEVVVVVLHWGVEYAPAPRPVERRLAQRLAAAGADAVVGAHPHIVQPIEVIAAGGREGRRTLVAYSLGNALFDQRDGAATRVGAALEVVVDAGGLASWRCRGIATRSGRRGLGLAWVDAGRDHCGPGRP